MTLTVSKAAHLLVSDVDDTLIGDAAAVERFADWYVRERDGEARSYSEYIHGRNHTAGGTPHLGCSAAGAVVGTQALGEQSPSLPPRRDTQRNRYDHTAADEADCPIV